MLIQICPSALCAAGTPEWVLLELQGKLECAGALGGRILGHLRQEDRGLVLRVGNHTVVGALRELPKALHVMQREAGGGGGEVRLVVRCIVRRKLVFTDRPQPVISSALGELSLAAATANAAAAAAAAATAAAASAAAAAGGKRKAGK